MARQRNHRRRQGPRAFAGYFTALSKTQHQQLKASPKSGVTKAGAMLQPANPAVLLERLVEALMEPVGREARLRAAEAIRQESLSVTR